MAQELTCDPTLSNDSEPWDFCWNYWEGGAFFLLELLHLPLGPAGSGVISQENRDETPHPVGII